MVATSLERQKNGGARFGGCSNIREFEFLGKLGEGTFGEVYKARSKQDASVVALKKILMHNEKDGFPITALREIKLLKMLSHPNILQLKEMAVERSKGEGRKKPSMYMVTPYMEHDLSGLLENPSVNFSESQVKCYMMQLLEGLKYLHGNRVLHRDMKAANLLISNKGILQIADFGLARPYDEPPPQPGKGGGEAKRDYTTLVVTRWYRPPELLLQLRRYTSAIDMWGAGCVFGEMFRGKPILPGSSDLNQAQLIFGLVGAPTDENMPGWSSLPGCEGVKNFGRRPGNLHESFKDLSPTAISLLSELLKLDWRKRINAIDALKHPYFSSHPLPARPGELPCFEDSHELDRRKFRGQRAAMPPAPQGGSIGMASSGGWANSGARTGMENRNNRIPGAARPGKANHPEQSFRHPHDNRGNELNMGRMRHGADGTSLPPKPPSSTRHGWGGQHYNRTGRDRGRQNRFSGRPEGNVDSYVPNHRGSGERFRGRYDDSPGSNADNRDRIEPHQANRRDNYRDHASRNRSRSPGARIRDRSADRGIYRR